MSWVVDSGTECSFKDKGIVGQLGAYIVAAELSKQGHLVTLTSRNAKMVDLLVSDHLMRMTGVQVKTMTKACSGGKRSGSEITYRWPIRNVNLEQDSKLHPAYVFVDLAEFKSPIQIFIATAEDVHRQTTAQVAMGMKPEWFFLFATPDISSDSKHGWDAAIAKRYTPEKFKSNWDKLCLTKT